VSEPRSPLELLEALATEDVEIAPDVHHLEIYTLQGLLTLLWHGDPQAEHVVVMGGGGMGGLLGPAGGLYHDLGRQLAAQGIGTIAALPLGEPDPEVVNLARATCLTPAALAAIDKEALAQDQRGYRVAASVYSGSPPAEQTLSESC